MQLGMKNFIIPVDFSDESLKGLRLALLFAKKKHVNIQMVYVQKKSSDYSAHTSEEEVRFATKKFDAIINEYSKYLENDSTLRYIIKRGKIYEEIVKQAESYKDCVICTSTHGASGFEELFIGSNAFRIISATKLPVFTINKGDSPDDFNRIILPIDSTPSTRQKVPITAELGRLFGAEIHVVSVSSSRNSKLIKRLDAYTNQVCGYLDSLKIKVTKGSKFGDNITDITLEYANSVNADLISIMTEQVTGFNLIMGNYAHQMLNKAEIPVLSVTPRQIGISGSFSTFGG